MKLASLQLGRDGRLAAVTGFGLIITGVAVLGFFSDSSLG